MQISPDARAATGRLIGLARLLGLFLDPPPATEGGSDETLDKVMAVLIDVRAHCRKTKNFEAADMIRDRLAEEGMTLEDRADGTTWRIG